MSPSWIAGLTFIGTSLFAGGAAAAIYSLVFHYRNQLDERIAGLNRRDTTQNSLFKAPLLNQGNYGVVGRWREIETYYRQAQLPIALDSFVGICVAAALVGAIAAYFATLRWWTIPLAQVVVFVPATMWVVYRHRRRKQALTLQLPKALDVISRAVHAGQTVPAAFQIVADDFDAPLGDEFRLCYEEQNLGIPHEQSLRNLAQRTQIMELQILVVALLIQRRSGGSMVELLGNLSRTVHSRLRLQDRVRALTGEGRMQATVLIALPTVAFFLLMVIAREYAQTLLAYPALLAGALVSQFLGALWIRRCINFEY